MRSIRRLRALSWVGVALALGLILLLTWTPVATVSGGCLLGIPCNAGHPIAFALLGLPMAGLFATSRLARRSPRRALAMAFLTLWIVAALDELVQPYVGRDASLQDWTLDMIGGIAAFFGGSVVLRVVLTRFAGLAPPEPAAEPQPAPTLGEPETRRPTSRRRRRRR